MDRAVVPGVGDRAWFSEDDRPGRRLAVHAHASRGQVNLSFWDGTLCRATFRLPEAEIPRLIDELTAAVGTRVESGPLTATLQLLSELEVGGPE